MNERNQDYIIYHSSYTEAVQEIERFAERNRFVVNPEEMASLIGLGPPKPRDGQTNKFTIQLYEEGFVPAGKALHIQIYGMGNRYELNMYISPYPKREYHWYESKNKDRRFDMRIEKNKEAEKNDLKEIIEIQEEVKITQEDQDIILEKGDRIEVLVESIDLLLNSIYRGDLKSSEIKNLEKIIKQADRKVGNPVIGMVKVAGSITGSLALEKRYIYVLYLLDVFEPYYRAIVYFKHDGIQTMGVKWEGPTVFDENNRETMLLTDEYIDIVDKNRWWDLVAPDEGKIVFNYKNPDVYLKDYEKLI